MYAAAVNFSIRCQELVAKALSDHVDAQNYPPRNLQRFFPAPQFGDIHDVVAVTMGQSGASVYSVTTKTGAYILRIHGQDHDSWKKVILTHETASQHGIAPAIVHIDHVERAVISVRVSGVSFGAAVSQPETRAAALRSLIEVLTKLHAIPTRPFAAIDLIGFARSVWDEQVQRQYFPAWAIPLGVVAFNMDSGELLWSQQLIQHDIRAGACEKECAEEFVLHLFLTRHKDLHGCAVLLLRTTLALRLVEQ